MKEKGTLPTTKRLRATPITIVLIEPEEGVDAYPDGFWVYAKTDLILPSKVVYPDENYADDVWCALHSPGDQAGGKTSREQVAVFEQEAVYLTRVLSYIGLPILAEEEAA